MEASRSSGWTNLVCELDTHRSRVHAEATLKSTEGEPEYLTPPMSRTTTPKRESLLTSTITTSPAQASNVTALQDRATPTTLPQASLPPRLVSQESASSTAATQYAVEAGQPSSDTVSFVTHPGHQARRAKSHVPSACINCKRAHLSCDVQRPCQRCVDTGKEATCVDVQHKKRGRPRLREIVEAGPSSTPQTMVRAIASTRSRRTGSFRSHQSQGSESSSVGLVTPQSTPYGIPPALPMYHAPPGAPATQELPTAILDLDLVVVRANRAFQRAVGSGDDLSMVRLADIAAPLDGEAFTTIRHRLRDERERHEPSFLPPIAHPSHHVLDSVQDADVDILTRGFADHTYTWRSVAHQAINTPLYARVRLAKITSYFAVVTLPETYGAPTPFGTTQPLATTSIQAPTGYMVAPKPPSYPATAMVPPQMPFVPPPQRVLEPCLTQTTQSLKAHELHGILAHSTAYYQPVGAVAGAASQHPATTSIASITTLAATEPEPATVGRSPRKRRRLGIDEVIQ